MNRSPPRIVDFRPARDSSCRRLPRRHERNALRPVASAHARSGFSLVEVSVTSALMAMLAMLLADGWAAIGRPLIDTAAQCRIAHEAQMALACLARDLGGNDADEAGHIGAKSASRFVGRTQPGGSQLWLCFDGGTPPNGSAEWGAPDTVITYEVVNASLVRWNQTADSTFVVAGHVTDFVLTDLGGGHLRIELTFTCRNITRTYTFIAVDP